MVEVGAKPESDREAVATSTIRAFPASSKWVSLDMRRR
jgi:hypothetical protein